MVKKNNIYKTKYSYGMAVCTLVNDIPQIVLCRKRISYEFVEFIHGKYTLPKEWGKVKALINKMTNVEKMEILSFNFNRMWRYASFGYPNDAYSLHCKYKFEKNFTNKTKLCNLIKNSSCGELIWDLPKGRPDKNESILDTAIRETREEIGLTLADYKLTFDKPITYNYVEYGVNYVMKFFLAEYIKKDLSTPFIFKNIDTKEVDMVKWWGKESIQYINTPLKKTILTLIDQYQNYIQH
jgi:ADP-ribose pyrophosphatase YjhB (NUDIX family)